MLQSCMHVLAQHATPPIQCTMSSRRYPSADYPSEFWRIAATLRDFVFACPTRRVARALEGHGMATWHYRFAPSYCRQPSAVDGPLLPTSPSRAASLALLPSPCLAFVCLSRSRLGPRLALPSTSPSLTFAHLRSPSLTSPCLRPRFAATWVDYHLLHCYHTAELSAVWGHAFPQLPALRQVCALMGRGSTWTILPGRSYLDDPTRTGRP